MCIRMWLMCHNVSGHGSEWDTIALYWSCGKPKGKKRVSPVSRYLFTQTLCFIIWVKHLRLLALGWFRSDGTFDVVYWQFAPSVSTLLVHPYMHFVNNYIASKKNVTTEKQFYFYRFFFRFRGSDPDCIKLTLWWLARNMCVRCSFWFISSFRHPLLNGHS